MLDSVLEKFSAPVRLTVKGLLSAVCVLLAAVLPQIAHAAGGVQAGTTYMPMYAPALLAGCLLGWRWGLGVGVLSPVFSFGFTSLFMGSAMPAVQRLPYMTIEIGLYGLVTGLLSEKIRKNVWLAFPAVAAAQAAGRTAYVIYNLIAGRSFSELWTSVQAGLTGLYLQLIIVPAAVVLISLFAYDRKRD